MRGRKPKAPGVRQRRNKPGPSAAILAPEGETSRRKVPELPKKNGGWTDQARECWAAIWRSPMAARYLKADAFRLEILIDLVDRYWRGETDLAAQIRLEGDSFATSPLARRRLEWEIRDQPDELPVAVGADGAPAPTPTRTKHKAGGPDPRNVLRGEFRA
jgi:hypothetical protein